MYQALIEHAKNDVDGKEGRHDQQRLSSDHLAESFCITGEFPVNRVGQMQLGDSLANVGRGLFQPGAESKVVGDRDRRKLALMIDDHRCARRIELDHAGQRYLNSTCARNVQFFEIRWISLEPRIDLEDHPILITLGVNGRNLPLRESIIERVVDILDLHAEPGSCSPVDDDLGLQTALLTVGRDVDQIRHITNSLEDVWHPALQFVKIGTPQSELVLRLALAGADPKILSRDHENPNAGQVFESTTQAIDDADRSDLAFGKRFQPDVDSPLMSRRIEQRGAYRGRNSS